MGGRWGSHGLILSRVLECLISTGTMWNLIYSGRFYDKFQVHSSVKPEVSLHVLLSLQPFGGPEGDISALMLLLSAGEGPSRRHITFFFHSKRILTALFAHRVADTSSLLGTGEGASTSLS